MITYTQKLIFVWDLISVKADALHTHTSEPFNNPDSVLFTDWKLEVCRYTDYTAVLVLVNAHGKEVYGNYRFSLLDEQHNELYCGENEKMVKPYFKNIKNPCGDKFRLPHVTSAWQVAIKCEIDMCCDLPEEPLKRHQRLPLHLYARSRSFNNASLSLISSIDQFKAAEGIVRQRNQHGLWNLQFENNTVHVVLILKESYPNIGIKCAKLLFELDVQSETATKVYAITNNTLRASFDISRIKRGNEKDEEKPSIWISFDVYGFRNDILPIVRNCTTSAKQMAIDLEAAMTEGPEDIKLEAEGGELIPVHKNVLIFRCPFFKEKLASGKPKNGIFPLEGIDKETIEGLLEYLYKGTVTDIDKTAERLLVAAGRLKLNVLKGMCENALVLCPKEPSDKERLRKLAMSQNAEYLLSNLDLDN